MSFNGIIVDDERPARERLKKFIKDYPFIDITAETDNGIKAVHLIDSLNPDLVFLDIQIPGLNGFQVINKIKKSPAFIFVTAYDEYAIQAFEVNAVDYLLKPFSKQRFGISMDRVLSQLNNNTQENTNLQRLINWYIGREDYLTRISFKVKNVYSVINIEEIFFFKLEDGSVYFYAEKRRHRIQGTLNQIEKTVDPAVFFRANRTAIINLSKIRRVLPWGQSRFAVEFDNNERIVISRERGKLFRRKVGIKLR